MPKKACQSTTKHTAGSDTARYSIIDTGPCRRRPPSRTHIKISPYRICAPPLLVEAVPCGRAAARTTDVAGEVDDALAKAVDDGLALARDTLALQELGLRVCLRRLHHLDLLRLRLLNGCHPAPE